MREEDSHGAQSTGENIFGYIRTHKRLPVELRSIARNQHGQIRPPARGQSILRFHAGVATWTAARGSASANDATAATTAGPTSSYLSSGKGSASTGLFSYADLV